MGVITFSPPCDFWSQRDTDVLKGKQRKLLKGPDNTGGHGFFFLLLYACKSTCISTSLRLLQHLLFFSWLQLRFQISEQPFLSFFLLSRSMTMFAQLSNNFWVTHWFQAVALDNLYIQPLQYLCSPFWFNICFLLAHSVNLVAVKNCSLSLCKSCHLEQSSPSVSANPLLLNVWKHILSPLPWS